MKKIFLIVTISLFLLSGCSRKEKAADPIDDNYRVFYEIFTGSFSDSNQDGIGDLQGIINRLDYLNDGNLNSETALGIQGIWLTPIFKSPSYHKYDVEDYYTIDPDFGTQEDLDELIERCHERNVLVILDLVINHTSSNHKWFVEFSKAHRNNDINNKYYDYYVYKQKDESSDGKSFCSLNNTEESYECNFSYDMPELNFDNEDVRNEVLDIAQYYLAKGVDGFRFDAAKYIYYNDNYSSVDFWNWYTGKLREIKPDIYLVGEVWSSQSEINRYIKEMNCFDFTISQVEGVIATAAKGGDINTFTRYVVNYQDKLKDINSESMAIPFISNHDMDRAAGYLMVSNGRAYIGANLLLLSPGSPFIYYGEEIGMKGSRGSENTDANRRLAMLWGDGDTVKDPVGASFDISKQVNGTVMDQLQEKNSILNHYIRLITIRNTYPQIARGNYSQLDMGEKNLGGFKIEYEGEYTYILHNNSDVEIAIAAGEFNEMLAYAGLRDASFKNKELIIGPYTSVILK